MKATVYYITLSQNQIDEINKTGWNSDLGQAYAKATLSADVKNALFMGLYKMAAKVENVNDSEEIFVALQHEQIKSNAVVVRTSYGLRSMMVGDIVVWENGKTEVVDSFSFKEIMK